MALLLCPLRVLGPQNPKENGALNLTTLIWEMIVYKDLELEERRLLIPNKGFSHTRPVNTRPVNTIMHFLLIY